MLNITCLCWLVLSIAVSFRLRQWDEKFSALFDGLKEQIRDDENAR